MLMTHHYDKPDLDTDTGLPRKLGWKVAFWAIGILQFIAVVGIGFVWKSVDEMKTRVARMEGRMGINVQATAPSVAVNPKKMEPMP